MPDAPKSFLLSPEMHAYLMETMSPMDEHQVALIAETERRGDPKLLQIAPEQAPFMTMLTRAIGARDAIELGTFTGLSALAMAQGLPDDGTIVCCDMSAEWTDVGRPFWEAAGVAHKIDLRIGPALETLRALANEAVFDLAFIDADKFEYIDYFEELLPRMRPGGVMLVDNVLAYGRVVDPAADGLMTGAFLRFNQHVAADPRVECLILPLADGLTFIRKK